MNTFMKLALVAAISGSAVLPIAAHAADKPAAPAQTASAEAQKPASFATMDKDKSGEVSMTEFMKNSGLKESPAKIRQEFASLDKNKDHKLSEAEVGATSVQ